MLKTLANKGWTDNERMKLDKIKLENFQAHRFQEIEFSSTITTLTGSSDAGKSAILRALRWICLNDLKGSDFIRHGKKQAKVTLNIGASESRKNLFTIIRAKGKSENSYRLNKSKYVAMGTKVPTDIFKTLNLSEINFQGQFDPPFWFGLSAPQVSRELNSVIDLSVIDSALSNAAGAIRKANDKKSVIEDRLHEIKTSLLKLKPQRERIYDFNALKEAKTELETIESQETELREILQKIQSNRADYLQQKAREGKAVLETFHKLRTFQKRDKTLEEIIHAIAQFQSQKTPPPSLTELEKSFEAWQKIEREVRDLSIMIAELKSAKRLEKSSRWKLMGTEIKLRARTKNQICPLCQQKINHSH